MAAAHIMLVRVADPTTLDSNLELRGTGVDHIQHLHGLSGAVPVTAPRPLFGECTETLGPMIMEQKRGKYVGPNFWAAASVPGPGTYKLFAAFNASGGQGLILPSFVLTVVDGNGYTDAALARYQADLPPAVTVCGAAARTERSGSNCLLGVANNGAAGFLGSMRVFSVAVMLSILGAIWFSRWVLQAVRLLWARGVGIQAAVNNCEGERGGN